MSFNDGWCENASQCVSPHFNLRPVDCDVSLLIIHNISLPPGQFGGCFIDDLFSGNLDCSVDSFFNQLVGLEVSAHFMINRGGKVTQYVSTDKRAWHAGVSNFQGIDNCNNFSVGIELEGTDTTPYTDEQYVALVELSKALKTQYPLITNDRIVGHCDIAPGRKTDPGEVFNWPAYKQQLK